MEAPDPLHSKGSGLLLLVMAIIVALVSCGGAWLAAALVLNFVATTAGRVGAAG